MGYVVVTVARNEETLIGRAIDSVLSQSVKPSAYVIVDDCSEDGTGKIISSYVGASDVPIIPLDTRMFKRHELRFANICRNQRIGFSYAEKLEPKYMVNLDADSTIPFDYMEKMLSQMENDETIGIASGVLRGRRRWKNRPLDSARVYRLSCFQDIKGVNYVKGFDTHAILKANMKGWKTPVFTNSVYDEFRTSLRTSFYQWYATGATRYFLGFPIWHTFCVLMMYLDNYPYLIGPLTMLLSHILFRIRNRGRTFSDEYYEYMKGYAHNELTSKLHSGVA